MKKLAFIVSLIIMTLVFSQVIFAYEDSEVICSIDSLINGVDNQGANVSETALGDITSAALCYVSGADIAIVNGGDLKNVIDAGTRTWSDIQAVFYENKKVAVARVTAADIWQILEYGVSYGVLGEDEKTDKEASDFEGYPQVAGLTFEYDLSAPAGSRVKYVCIGDDVYISENDTRTTFDLCASEFMLEGGYGYQIYEYESLNTGLAQCLAEYLSKGTYTATTLSAGRIKTIGSKDNPLLSRGVLFLVGLFICLCCYIASKAKRRADPDRSIYSYIDPNR